MLAFEKVTIAYDETGQPLSVIDIRPMDAGDILDGTIRVYRRNPWCFVSILAAIVGLPLFLAEIPTRYMRQIIWGSLIPALWENRVSDALEILQSPETIRLNIFINIAAAVVFFLIPIVQAATVHAVSQTILGHNASLADSIKAIFKRIGKIFLAYILYVIIMFLSFLPFVLLALFVFYLAASSEVQGNSPPDIVKLASAGIILFLLCLVGVIVIIYLAVKLLFISHAVVLDKADATGALRRSFFLTTGYWWRTVSIYLTMSIIVLVISSLFGLAGTLIETLLQRIPAISVFLVHSIGAAVSTALNLTVSPVLYIATTLMYYDLRIRKEGFDVILLAQSLMGIFDDGSESTNEVPIG